MAHEHLIGDIQNVLELVNRAERDPERREEARNALRGLHRHFADEESVPGTVRGCLEEAASSASTETAEDTSWRSARACLETALEFARGE